MAIGATKMLFPDCCYYCGKQIKKKTNARQRYCDDRCRQAAHRRDERWKNDPDYVEMVTKHYQNKIGIYPEGIRTDLLDILNDHGPRALVAAEAMLRKYDWMVSKLVDHMAEERYQKLVKKRDTT